PPSTSTVTPRIRPPPRTRQADLPKSSPMQRLNDWVEDLVYRIVHAGASLPAGGSPFPCCSSC
ncbi:hypothetical protein I553_3806, partial [Mycobacterium xenopi 4042]